MSEPISDVESIKDVEETEADAEMKATEEDAEQPVGDGE